MSIDFERFGDSVRVRHRGRDEGVLGHAAGVAGLLLLLLPAAFARPEGGLAIGGIIALEVALLLSAWRLLAESSRRGTVSASLHLGSGELSVERGRGIFRTSRAYGAVEADGLLLTRTLARGRHFFRLDLLLATGSPVALIRQEEDEVAVREAGLVLSQGMELELEDRRYTAGSGDPPNRVARRSSSGHEVFVWSYRDRLRPRAALLALGVTVALLTLLPSFVMPLGLALLVPAAVATIVALGLAAHLIICLSVRRVTVRPDAARVERRLGGVSLQAGLAGFEEISAVLVTRRGPFARLRLRTHSKRNRIALPFEDPALAGWLRMILERAVHDAARDGTMIPAGEGRP